MSGKQASRLDVRPNRQDVLTRVLEMVLLVVIGMVGVLMTHHPMLLSGFRRMQTDLGDSRFIHYMLEHGYRWVIGERGHESLWSPPFYYPAPNAAAYSDLFLGVGPVYWSWRLLGVPVDVSFGLWMVSMSVLNYAAGLLLFRFGLRFGLAASVAGATLVAFAAPRVNQMSHQQLLPCFYLLIAVYCLTRLAREESMRWRTRAGYWLIAVLAVVAQLYSGVYVGWFFVMATVITVIAAACLRGCRGRLISIIWRDAWTIAVASVTGLLLMRPFLDHYGRAAAELTGSMYLPGIVQFQPRFWSWFSMGEGNWLWGWTAYREPFRAVNYGSELHLGIGLLTLPICCAGLVTGRSRPICQLGAAVMGAAWLGTTRVPGDRLSTAALVASLYCGAGLFHERSAGGFRFKAVVVVVLVGLCSRFPNIYLQVVMLGGIVFGLLSLHEREGVTGSVLVISALAFALFPAVMILYGMTLAFVVWMPMAYLFRGRRREIAVVFGWLVLGLLAYTTLGDRPPVLVWTAVGVPVALGLTAWRRLRPSAWLMFSTIMVSVPFISLFYSTDSLWLKGYYWIPGAQAIRVLARAVLILLVPAAVGLACVVERLEQKRWRIAAWSLVSLCLAEQLVTTESYDVADNRSRIEAIARRVDLNREAFFYYRAGHGASIHDQLDALWASMWTGVPTVNGYSGYYPGSWKGFTLIDTKDGLNLAETLEDWEKRSGLEVGSVQLIDGFVEFGEGGRTGRGNSRGGFDGVTILTDTGPSRLSLY